MTNVGATPETTGDPEVSYVTFSVDMNGVDYPNADYDNVVVNGSWNNWAGWGVTLMTQTMMEFLLVVLNHLYNF